MIIKSPEVKVPETHADVIAFRAEQAKRQDLINKFAAKQSQEIAATERWVQRKQQSVNRSSVQVEAEELLAGAEAGSLTEDLKDIEKLRHDIDVLASALDQQKLTLDVLQGRFDRAVHDANSSTHIRIARRNYRAVQEIAAASEEEVRFFEALRDAGCHSILFRPTRMNEVGLASDSQSRAAFHRHDIEQYVPEAID